MEKTPNIQPSVIKAAMISSTTSASCVCPCHMHDKDETCAHKTSVTVVKTENPTKKMSNACSGTCSNGTATGTGSTATLVNYKNSRTPKIIIDGSSTLPTKRESIRMLIENKAVSENKQKNALEMHLNTLICSRKTTTNTAKVNT